MRILGAGTLTLGLFFFMTLGAPGQVGKDESAKEIAAQIAAGREKGLDYLTKNQEKDGHFGKTYTIAATSFACLAYLSASDEPFDGDRGKALVKALNYLLSHHDKGMFKSEGHSWIHGQGFATLALSEAYGRSLFCKIKPDLDMNKVKEVVIAAVGHIGKNQSNSGGWWYTAGSLNQHEGSTTVCAVQALVSASNFKIVKDEEVEKVMDKGFKYLKECQTKEGGFNYQLGDGRNMHEGTAAAVATLGLMQKFDFTVMINGYKFLQKITPRANTNGSFPYYGHFYGCMGMHLLWQEYKSDKEFNTKTKAYILESNKDVLSWQQKDGSFQLRGWAAQESPAYSTAFGLLSLYVTEGRLSILNRDPPRLPKS